MMKYIGKLATFVLLIGVFFLIPNKISAQQECFYDYGVGPGCGNGYWGGGHHCSDALPGYILCNRRDCHACTPGGGGGTEQITIKGLVYANEEGKRYSPNGCANNGSGVEVSVNGANSEINWNCDFGGEFVVEADENGSVTFTVTQLPFGFDRCQWFVENTSQSGNGCSVTFANVGDQDWANKLHFNIYQKSLLFNGIAYCQRPDGSFTRVPGMQIQRKLGSDSNWTNLTNTNSNGEWSFTAPIGIWNNNNLQILGNEDYPNAGSINVVGSCIDTNIFGITFNSNLSSINETQYCGDPNWANYNPARDNIAINNVSFNTGACVRHPGTTWLGCNAGPCNNTNNLCDPDLDLRCSTTYGNVCRKNGIESDPSCGTTTTNTCGDGIPGGPGETCDDGNQDLNDACDTFGTAQYSAGACKATTCGDGYIQTYRGEECDTGPNLSNTSTCNTQCKKQVLLTGRVNAGAGTLQPNGGYSVCQGSATGSFNPAPSGSVTYRILTNPPAQQTSNINSDGTFSAWLRVGGGAMPDVAVRLPDSISGSPVNCAPAGSGYSVQTVRADYSTTNGTLNFYYTDTTTTPINPWYQTQGGLIYGGGNITNSSMPSGSYFSLRVGANIKSAAIPWSGGSIMNLGSGLPRQSTGLENQKVVGSTPTHTIEGYEFFTKKYNLNEAYLLGSTINSAPPCNNSSDGSGVALCKTNGNLTIDINNTAWNVQSNGKVVVFVDGNLTIKNSTSLGKIISTANRGFLAFIVNGSITFDPSVGNTNPADNTPNVEGVFVGNTITVQGLESGTDKRFVGAGSFIATEGSITLSRDIGGSNNGTPAELFIYRPDFTLNVPQKLQNYTLEYREVN